MSRRDHIINILKEVRRGPNQGEDLKTYLERMAESILSYVPEEEKPKKSSKKEE